MHNSRLWSTDRNHGLVTLRRSQFCAARADTRRSRTCFKLSDRAGQGRRGDQFRVRSTSLFFVIQGIMARSFSPTASIGCAAPRVRIALNEGCPALFSRTQSRAKRPDWISARIAFMAALDSGPTTRGPETYSPYSAVFETE